MKIRAWLFFLSIFSWLVFTFFSYSVAKEDWQRIDFDTTVKLQDHISRKWDEPFSYFSLLGSVEVTLAVSLILAFWYLIRGSWVGALGWLFIMPASIGEVFGKMVLFHPGPPVLFHRSVLATNLPSFYIHTDFSYPSGHMTRTAFLVTVAICLLFWQKNFFSKLTIILLLFFAVMMALTRVYLGEHWLSDILGGALLGLSSGLFASILILPKQPPHPVQGLPS